MSTFAKTIIILGAVCVLAVITLVAAFGGTLYIAQQQGESAQEAFFQAINSGKAEQVLKQCHPALREEIDVPVLTAWMQAIQEHLGEFQGLSATNFTSSGRISDGTLVLKIQGEVQLERGTAQSELVTFGGKLTRFNVDTKALPNGWFQGPAKSDLYQTRSKKFLNTFLKANGDDIREQMDDVLKGMANDKELADQLAWLTGYAGEIKSIDYVSEGMETIRDHQRLTVRFLAKGTEANVEATVSFQFEGLKGYLIAYHWKPTDLS